MAVGPAKPAVEPIVDADLVMEPTVATYSWLNLPWLQIPFRLGTFSPKTTDLPAKSVYLVFGFGFGSCFLVSAFVSVLEVQETEKP